MPLAIRLSCTYEQNTSLLWINTLGFTRSYLQSSYWETNIYTGKILCSWRWHCRSQRAKLLNSDKPWVLDPSWKVLWNPVSSFVKLGNIIYLVGLLWRLSETVNVNGSLHSVFVCACVRVCTLYTYKSMCNVRSAHVHMDVYTCSVTSSKKSWQKSYNWHTLSLQYFSIILRQTQPFWKV